MKISDMIDWNGFLETIVKPSRSNQESCAWIFADIKTDMWNVIEVKNVGLKGRKLKDSFAPDKKEFAKAKRLARKEGWTKIGNIHTHVVVSGTWREAEQQLRPSEVDLKYARRYNDIVRAVIVVKFPDRRSMGKIYGIVWFDQYGKILRKRWFT